MGKMSLSCPALMVIDILISEDDGETVRQRGQITTPSIMNISGAGMKAEGYGCP
jgi:hypothetical protein